MSEKIPTAYLLFICFAIKSSTRLSPSPGSGSYYTNSVETYPSPQCHGLTCFELFKPSCSLVGKKEKKKVYGIFHRMETQICLFANISLIF